LPEAQFVLREVGPVDRPDEFRCDDGCKDSIRKWNIEYGVLK
jgi:hypothetical protein